MNSPAHLRIAAQAEPEELSGMTVAEEKALRERMRRMEEVLCSIQQRTMDDVHELPSAVYVPHACMLGSLLYIGGLCQAGLAE